MSTLWVPLSISTPPPLTAGSVFQRPLMSATPVKTFSSIIGVPISPSAIISRARMTSSTKRNFEAIDRITPFSVAARVIATAPSRSTLSGFSHSTGSPRDTRSITIGACVTGGVATMTASQPPRSASSRCDPNARAPASPASASAAPRSVSATATRRAEDSPATAVT